jgi:hypothetical protein
MYILYHFINDIAIHFFNLFLFFIFLLLIRLFYYIIVLYGVVFNYIIVLYGVRGVASFILLLMFLSPIPSSQKII